MWKSKEPKVIAANSYFYLTEEEIEDYENKVEQGDEVEAGQKIGEVGETGMATGPHLDVQWDGDCDGVFDRNNRMDNPANLFFGGAY